MTRVNLVNPIHLSDQHLIAEHREYGIAVYSFKNSLQSRHGIVKNKISSNYTLNKGHVYFFYDKMLFLKKRHLALKVEARRRGFNLLLEPDWSGIPTEYLNDWIPTHKECIVNIERLLTRIGQKPKWYRFYSKPLMCDFYAQYQTY